MPAARCTRRNALPSHLPLPGLHPTRFLSPPPRAVSQHAGGQSQVRAHSHHNSQPYRPLLQPPWQLCPFAGTLKAAMEKKRGAIPRPQRLGPPPVVSHVASPHWLQPPYVIEVEFAAAARLCCSHSKAAAGTPQVMAGWQMAFPGCSTPPAPKHSSASMACDMHPLPPTRGRTYTGALFRGTEFLVSRPS